MSDLLADFARADFTHEAVTHHYYRLGSGPAVIVLAEVPGITPKVIEFARRVAATGLTVYVPSLFGTDGAAPMPDGVGDLPRTGATWAKSLGRICVSREFTVLATGRSSPVVGWLRGLAAQAHTECGGPGVGAVGMCVTGGFALAMAVDDRLLAPVLSQPSLPLRLTPGRKRSIDISDDDLAVVQARCARGLKVFGTRFEGDCLVPDERFAFLKNKLGAAFIDASLPADAANPAARTPPHSVLTEHLDDRPGQRTRQTLDDVLDFLATRLEVRP